MVMMSSCTAAAAAGAVARRASAVLGLGQWSLLGSSSAPLRSTCCRWTSSAAVSAKGESSPRKHMALVLERLPVLIREEPEWSVAFRAFAARRRAQTGRRVPADVRAFFRLPENWEDHGAEIERLRAMRKLPRVTDADERGDVRSLNRKLEERLFLVVAGASSYLDGTQETTTSQSPSGGGMGFPALAWEESCGHTGRALADKALVDAKLKTQNDFETFAVGNPPAAHVQGANGDTVFFFRSQLVVGDVTGVGDDNSPDFAWLSLDELLETMPEEWRATVQTMLR